MTFFDGIDAMLADARSRLERLEPGQALAEVRRGEALLVDTRPDWQREAEGEVDPALRPLLVERNHLEWRFDPRSDARVPEASYDARVVVLCQEGYSSSLAADALVRLGVRRATDVIGGFAAWREAGLPLTEGFPERLPTRRTAPRRNPERRPDLTRDQPARTSPRP